MSAPFTDQVAIIHAFAERLDADPEQAPALIAALPSDDPVLLAVDDLARAADADDEAERGAGIGALFGQVVEFLNDSFKPHWRDLYSRCFARVIATVAAGNADLQRVLDRWELGSDQALFDRHARIRSQQTPVSGAPQTIAVLSRVTVGADILLSSVVLQHLHRRWPDAEILFYGDGKLGALLGGLDCVRVIPLSYTRRGRLSDRLLAWTTLSAAIEEAAPDLVISPDSRLDQLGLLPVVGDDRYRLWENTQPTTGPRSLADLLDDWCRQICGTTGEPVRPSIGLDAASSAARMKIAHALGPEPVLAVKLDHGGNPAKALPRAQEIAMLRHCRQRGWRILLDRGFGKEELANSDALMQELGWEPADIDDSGRDLGRPVDQLQNDDLVDAAVIRFHGSIAGWAAAVSVCRLAFSYDSVGHHLAAAAGTPTVTAFTGYRDPAFPIAWHPRGRAPVQLVRIPPGQVEEPEYLRSIFAALDSFGPR